MIGYGELWRRRHELLFKKDYARAPRYARWVSHRLTPLLVYGAARAGLTPNQVTVVSLALGLAGCWWLSRGGAASALAGALLVEAYYVLDSVDGQLARWTQRFSKSGTFLDILGNYTVQPLVLASLGMGLAAASGDWRPAALGSLAALGCVWLGMMWEVRSALILANLKREAHPIVFDLPIPDAKPSRRGTASAWFSFLHKLCTYPSLMNLLTVCALASWSLRSSAPLEAYLLFYALTLPAVSTLKALKMFSSGEIDREYDQYAGRHDA